MDIIYYRGIHLKKLPCYENMCQEVRNINTNLKAPFFISGWDSRNSCSPFLENVLTKSWEESKKDLSHYFNAEEDYINKNITNYILTHFNISIELNQIIIAGSATSLILLSVLFLSLKPGLFLIIAPAYFSFTDILPFIHDRAIIVAPNDNMEIDYDMIEDILQHENILSIIVTDPLFGYGLSLSNAFYKNIISLSNKYHITIICDLARKGPFWDRESHLLGECFSSIVNAENYMVIYSPCKMIDLNGLKAGVLLFSKDLQEVRTYCDAVLGSVSAPQLHFLSLILDRENSCYVQNEYQILAEKAKDNYNLIRTMLLGSQMTIVRPQEGYFATLLIPKPQSIIMRDETLFTYYLNKHRIVTLPHSLYYYPSDKYYRFRVNLLLGKENLLPAISLLSTQENIL